MIRTRAQQDAEQALGQVTQALKDLDATAAKRYGVQTQRLPLIIREQGLLAALGFLHTKANGDPTSPEGLLAAQLADTLGLQGDPIAIENDLAQRPLADYLRLTQRALECLQWHKRITEARLGQEVRNG